VASSVRLVASAVALVPRILAVMEAQLFYDRFLAISDRFFRSLCSTVITAILIAVLIAVTSLRLALLSATASVNALSLTEVITISISPTISIALL